MPGLRVFRCLRPPFVSRVKIGPSLAKIPLDALLTLTAMRRAVAGQLRRDSFSRRGRADRRRCSPWLLRVPHLYDMHSSLPQQLHEFRVQPLAHHPARCSWRSSG